jgi:hypothetical protein
LVRGQAVSGKSCIGLGDPGECAAQFTDRRSGSVVIYCCFSGFLAHLHTHTHAHMRLYTHFRNKRTCLVAALRGT